MTRRLVGRPIGAYVPVSSGGASPVAASSDAAVKAQAVGSTITDAFESIPVNVHTWDELTGQKIAQTTRPWRALDVFVSPRPVDDTVRGTLSIFVWALNKGIRTLVSSGRVVVTKPSTSVGAKALTLPQWTVAVRTPAESFEVTALWQFPALSPGQGGDVNITVVGSNDETPPPPFIGVVSLGLANGGSSVATILNTGAFSLVQPELVSVRAINGSAAARYLHAHDTHLGTTLIAGIAPMLAWPMGAAIGSGIFESFIGFRANERLQLAVSSALLTTTAVADCAVSAMVR